MACETILAHPKWKKYFEFEINEVYGRTELVSSGKIGTFPKEVYPREKSIQDFLYVRNGRLFAQYVDDRLVSNFFNVRALRMAKP
jgi:hypothetical protein